MSETTKAIESLSEINNKLKEAEKRIKQIQENIDWINSLGFDFQVINKR